MGYLLRGHAIHFRCRHPEAAGMRVDVMSVMRGVDRFAELWERRVTVEETDSSAVYELLSIPDLVRSKKTQRGKDWPMIRRLLEADYLSGGRNATPQRVRFWLRELRTPEFLLEVGQREPESLRQSLNERALLAYAMKDDLSALSDSLEAEEKLERERDRFYWQPLKEELESLRHKRG
jgi:hypothetical protein